MPETADGATALLARVRARVDGVAARLGAERVAALAAWTAVALLVLALVPLLGISVFNHSYADDWHYGVDAHLALQATGSVLEALRAALAEVADAYVTWQGTYSAIFLMSLQPGVFGEGWYALAAPLILVSLAAATAYASHALVRGVLRADRSTWLLVTALVLLLQTQLLPSPVEGIFWYNSAVYYTFYHSLMLVMVGLAARMLVPGADRAVAARRAVLLAVLAFIVAGGNFVTALLVLEALAAAVAVLVIARDRRWMLLAPALAVHVAGFAASVLAPGNAERQASQFPADALSAPATIVRSAFAGWEYGVLWVNGLLVLAVLVAVPFLARAARGSSLSFRYPGAAVFAALAFFATSFTPTFKSMGSVGPGRVQNVRYYLFVVLVFVCATWIVGWWVRRRDGSGAAPHRFPDPVRAARRALLAWAAVCGCVLCIACSFALDERHVDDLASFSAAASLASGEAAAYDAQVDERLALLESSSSSTIEVPFYTAGPKVLFMGDVRDNMGNYVNFRLAQWYGKDSVVGYVPGERPSADEGDADEASPDGSADTAQKADLG